MRAQFNLYLFVAVLFVVGGIFGALLVNALTLEQQQELASEVGQYVQSMKIGLGAAAEDIFWERFFFHLKWLVLIWLLGVTVVGIPGILVLNFLKGALIGFSIGILIQQYEWKGVFFSFLTLAPQNAIAVPALMITSVASISFGVYMVKNRLLQQSGALLPQLGSLTSTAMIMLVLFAGAALVEAFISPSVIGWAAPYLSAQNGMI
ncbi:stage II sporulation protein M [Paenibacillus paeoniae]|uniref:stage II sporulation protein M n=1 Tax=Paenibacillus paeoniae TaxID=2292705 RepID=UPI001F0BAF85|nr:stage II sporulation protein M [Paenibacillus paeoniae]